MKDTSRSSNPPWSSDLSDEKAVARARRGDHDAFRVLVERYQDRVFRLALRVLRDEEMARDAAQEAFLKAYRSLRRFEGRSRFYTWLYRLVVNLCLDLKRRDRSGRHVAWEEERGTGGEAAGADAGAGGEGPTDPEREHQRRELGAQLERAIATLSEEARQTLLLREVDGLSYAEIAEALEIPKGTVMSRLHHARRRVQEALRAEGVEPGVAPQPASDPEPDPKEMTR